MVRKSLKSSVLNATDWPLSMGMQHLHSAKTATSHQLGYSAKMRLMDDRNHRMKRRAFSLIEVLVVISILVILIALVYPALNSVMKRASSASSVQTMRGIHVALSGYVTDNSGIYPYARPAGIFAVPRNKNELIYSLAPYLSDVPTGHLSATDVVEEFCTPAWLQEVDELNRANAAAWLLNHWVSDTDTLSGNREAIWGRYNNRPMRPVQIARPQNVKFLTEIDAVLAPWASNVPLQPVHGNIRNVLFLDGHIEAETVVWPTVE